MRSWLQFPLSAHAQQVTDRVAELGAIERVEVELAHAPALRLAARSDAKVAAASSRKRKKQSGEKKNWVIARSAPASTFRFRFSRSNARDDESGCTSG